MGIGSHLGAGVILSNLRLDKKNIRVEHIETNLRKIGAFVGDGAQVGCNSVTMPGTVIMPGAIVYPVSSIGGVIGTNNQKNYRIERI